eukprot:TRINITY_DN18224_c0_g1_i2.p1 TRINITY_DN18224_c0_g1~~TRINITY_DN18224_c0_g1_i2.p1  ORF type:complete len:148 (-),score=48.08 TRINITY_DN18224_c0_g1_i2:3-422(-)
MSAEDVVMGEKQSSLSNNNNNKRLNRARQIISDLENNALKSSTSFSNDPWQDLSIHLNTTRELVEAKHKRKMEKQFKTIAELEARLAQANAEITQFRELHNRDRTQNVELINKIAAMETSIHSITTNDRGFDPMNMFEM